MFEELIEAIVNLFGIGLIGMVFVVGGFLTNLIGPHITALADKHNLGYNRTTVSLICKGVVIVVSLIICLPSMPSFFEVLDNIMPLGT